MSISVNNALSSTLYVSKAKTPKAPEVQAFRQLSEAMKSGDMDAAKKAYAQIVKNAPDSAKWKPDSNFAQLGKALASGDMSAAQTAYSSMVSSHMKPPVDTPVPAPTPTPTPVETSSNTSSGLVNLTA